MRRISIGQRLFLSAALWSGAVLLFAGIALGTFYRRTAEQSFDERLHVYLRQLVADLAAPTLAERNDLGNLGEPRFEVQSSGWYWQIIRLDGNFSIVKTSRSLFGQLLPRLSQPAEPDGFLGRRRSDYIPGLDGRRLRMVERRIDLAEDGAFLISVSGDADELDNEVREFTLSLWITMLVLFVALVATTGFQVRFGLRPLAELRSAVGSVREAKADRIEGAYPPDVAPLARELNLLIDANRDILERARTQVGNLAHALKTPLSVVANEASEAPGSAREKIGEQVVVMRQQIDHYLNRARAAALAGALGTSTDVEAVLAGLLRTFNRIHQDRGIVFGSVNAPTLQFRGERQDFEEMVGNLLDNAGKWARSAVQAQVEAAPGDRPMLRVVIDDDGPGVPPEQRFEMLQRGRRLDESKPGSGLGLSIVVDLAASYGGSLALETAPAGGLRAVLTLPAIGAESI